ncbi:MAG: hypothetical protein AAFP18_02485 [Bacteroidota bacterium]
MASSRPTAECALCHQVRELHDSHIIPEFFYKPLYDSKGRVFDMSTVETTGRPFGIEQKGLREYLLCGYCESKLSRWETVAATLFRSGQLNVPAGQPLHTLTGLDYHNLRLFFLSILWRSSVSSLPFFKHVSLGPHEERIRVMLLDEEREPFWKYGCVLQDIASDSPEERLALIGPVASKAGSAWNYFYVIDGFLWHYIMASHSVDQAANALMLQSNGSLTITRGNAEKIPHLNALKDKLHGQGKLAALIEKYGQDA